MSEQAFTAITQEELLEMVDRVAVDSKSIYAPSGLPDPRLAGLFKDVMYSERTIQSRSSDQIVVNVTFLLDLASLSEASQVTLDRMTIVLLNDGHRRLARRQVSVEDSSVQQNPDRLVYSCAKSQRSRIKKFIKAWNKDRQLDT